MPARAARTRRAPRPAIAARPSAPRADRRASRPCPASPARRSASPCRPRPRGRQGCASYRNAPPTTTCRYAADPVPGSSNCQLSRRIEEIKLLGGYRKSNLVAGDERGLRIDPRHHQAVLPGSRLYHNLRAELLDDLDTRVEAGIRNRAAEHEMLGAHAEYHFTVAPGGERRGARR